MSEHETDDERRASERRWVMLRVVLEEQSRVHVAQTVNVSDSGILIERVPGLELVPGQQLSAVIEGLIDDEDNAGNRVLSVVRSDANGIALRFVESSPPGAADADSGSG